MPRYQISKIFFVEADDIEHAKELAKEIQSHKVLEIVEVKDGD